MRTAVINDQDGKLLTDSEQVLRRWTEYCKGLYNYEIHPDTSLPANQSALHGWWGYSANIERGGRSSSTVPETWQVTWSGQHTLWTGKKWRQRSCQGPNSSMSADQGTEKVAKGVDTIIDDTTTKERKSQAMWEPQNDKPNQPSQ